MEPLLRHQIFNRALVQAVRHGDLLVVQWFVEEYLPTGKIREPVREAAECGQLAILQWLFTNHAARMVWSIEELGRAATRDHFTTVQWLYEIQLHIGVLDDGDSGLFEVLCHAARNGNLEMVQWADQRREQNWVVTDAEPVMCAAARSGHLAVLEYFSAHCSAACARACLQNALWGCQLEVAQWASKHGSDRRIRASDLLEPAQHGCYDLISWALQELTVEDSCNLGMVLEDAAAAGHLHLVMLLYNNYDIKIGTDEMDKAARNGHLAVVQWLHEKCGARCTASAMDQAAANGHLDIVQWLHFNRTEGCSTFAMDRAAKDNHLDVIKWLHANRSEGCTRVAMNFAAGNGHLELVQWLHENRTEGCTALAMTNAASNGHLEVVRWLHENLQVECLARAMDDAAKNGHLAVLQWLHANRTEGCTREAFREPVNTDRVDIVKWLLANKPNDFCADAIGFAAESGNFEVLKAVLDHAKVNGRMEMDVSYLRSAFLAKQYEVVEWLADRYRDRTPGLEGWLQDGALRERNILCDAYARDLIQGLRVLR